jgi:hypothetical protein
MCDAHFKTVENDLDRGAATSSRKLLDFGETVTIHDTSFEYAYHGEEDAEKGSDDVETLMKNFERSEWELKQERLTAQEEQKAKEHCKTAILEEERSRRESLHERLKSSELQLQAVEAKTIEILGREADPAHEMEACKLEERGVDMILAFRRNALERCP